MAPPPSRLAIDLSGVSIRVVDGVLGGPMRCGSAALPDGASTSGKITDPAAVGRTLRALLARTEIMQTRGLVAAADAVATFRTIEVPASSSPKEIDAAVAKELAFEPQRMATRWTDVGVERGVRVVYAVAWDRALMKNLTEAVKDAGVDPTVVELKSASLTRVVAAPTCIVVDLSGSPAEVILIDGHLPQLWHSVNLADPLGAAAGPALAAALRTVLRYYQRRTDGQFPASAPILISSEHTMPAPVLTDVAERVGHPVAPIAVPERVPTNVRAPTYLTCLGLLMRRAG